MQNILLAVGNYSMTGIAAALTAYNQICRFGKEVNNLTLALISPLGADYECVHDVS